MSESQLRLLLVAEEGLDLALIRNIPELQCTAYDAPTTACTPGADEQYDMVVLDGNWLQRDPETVAAMIAANPRLPLTVIARDDAQEDLALAALNRGLDDYLCQQDLTATTFCGMLRNVRRLRLATQQRDEARRQLALTANAPIVPPHFAEHLRMSLTTLGAISDRLRRHAEGTRLAPLARRCDAAATELLQTSHDLADGPRLQQASLPIRRRRGPLAAVADQACAAARPACRRRQVTLTNAGQAFGAAVFDQELAGRGVTRLIQWLAELLPPGAAIELIGGRQCLLGIGLSVSLTEQQRNLTGELTAAGGGSGGPRIGAPGEPGFERSIASRMLEVQQIMTRWDVSPQGDTLWLDFPSTSDLAARWVAWNCEQQLRPVTLYEFTLPEKLDDQAVLAERFLQASLPARDLVCQRDAQSWIVALCSDGQQGERRMEHLAATWSVIEGGAAADIALVATYHLPLEAEELTQRIDQLVQAAPRSGRILLLEDPSRISPLGRQLADAGYDVLAMDTCHDALEADAIVVGAGHRPEQLKELEASGATEQIPVFLLSTDLQHQQRQLQQQARFVLDQDAPAALLEALAAGSRPKRPRAAAAHGTP